MVAVFSILLTAYFFAPGLSLNCARDCTAVYDPVCGNDGKTYSNACVLKIASCQATNKGDGVIVEVHQGNCHDIVRRATTSCDKYCNEERAPVCGSDGVVYENTCHYDIANCLSYQRNRTRLHIVSYTSFCPTPTKPNCEQYSRNMTDFAMEFPLGADIRVMCTHHGHEVCTNAGTFKSECELCKKIETDLDKLKHYPTYHVHDYHVLYEGPCLTHH